MRLMKRAGLGAVALAALVAGSTLQADAQSSPPAKAKPPAQPDRTPIPVWVFKPKSSPYVAPNKPVWHIADILAAHKGRTDWSQQVIKDRWFNVSYVSMGPDKKTPVSFEADDVIWFVVKSGQIRFTVKGHDPFVATKDFIVQIPMRTPYSMETVGNAPSVRLQVRTAGDAPVFPVADNPSPPAAPAGFETVKVTYRAPNTPPNPSQKLALDYDKDVEQNPNPPEHHGPNFFVQSARAFAVPIRSAPAPVAADDVGHFHTGLAEFWYVLEGDMDTRIEGQGVVHAHYRFRRVLHAL